MQKKTARKNTKYWKNETILKFGHLAKAILFSKWSVWVKNLKCQKHAKNDSTRTLELFCAKTAPKNTKYSRNETIVKLGHFARAIAHAKAIAFAKWSVWVKNLKCQKYPKNDSTTTLELFCAKNSTKKYSRNETILKIGYFAKAIAHVKAIAFKKWSPWVKN